MSDAPGVLLCGDLGSERCGVGASEAAALDAVTPRPTVVDPRRVGAALRALIAARRTGSPVVVVYPTRSTVRSVPATVTLLLATVTTTHRRLRWHLHEYSIFGERRALLDLLLAIGGGRVVVSTPTEAAALRRRRDVHVLPPANGTPLGPPADLTPADPPIIGLFGTARPDKGIDVVTRCLAPGGPIAVETIGEGWDEVAWPEGVEPRHHGRVATSELAARMGRWTLAIAPFAEGATDGRMSLRTPLTCGVPTLTTVSRPEDLTLRPPHLLLTPATAIDEAQAIGPADRAQGAAEVARFEADAVKRLADVLWGPA